MMSIFIILKTVRDTKIKACSTLEKKILILILIFMLKKIIYVAWKVVCIVNSIF